MRSVWRWSAAVLFLLASIVVFTTLEAGSLSLVCNSLYLVCATLALSMPPGVILAWLLIRTDLPGRRVVLVLLASMLFVPLYLQAAGWEAGFGLQGWYTIAWHGPPLLDGWRGVIWIHTTAAIPWIVCIVGAGFWLIEPDLEEQAILDGPPWQVFLKVTLPGALGAALVAALWVAIVTAGEMTVTDLFAIRTYAEAIYTTLAGSSEEGPAGAVPGILLTAWLVSAGLILASRLTSAARPVSLRPHWVFRLGPWRWPVAVAVALLFMLLVGVPLGNLAFQAGKLVVQTDEGRIRSWSLARGMLTIAASLWDARRELGWSLLIGSFSATSATALAAVMAWLARRGGWSAAAVFGSTGMMLAVPGPLLGLAVLWLRDLPLLRLDAGLVDLRSLVGPDDSRPPARDPDTLARLPHHPGRHARFRRDRRRRAADAILANCSSQPRTSPDTGLAGLVHGIPRGLGGQHPRCPTGRRATLRSYFLADPLRCGGQSVGDLPGTGGRFRDRRQQRFLGRTRWSPGFSRKSPENTA